MINILHLGLSFACNMRCRNCFVERTEDRLRLEDYYQIIDELYKQGLFVIIYTYGEPLLSPLFPAVAQYAKSKGLVQVLMSNGSLIDDNWVHRLKDLGISTIYISLDSVSGEQHDNYRGLKGSHNLAINAIKKCVSFGVNVGIAHTVNRDNVMDLFEMYKLANTLQVKCSSFLRSRINKRIVQFSPTEFAQYKHFFIHCMLNQEVLRTNFHDPTLSPVIYECHERGIVYPTIYERFSNMNTCHYMQTLSISPDGIVRHCNLCGSPIGTLSPEHPITDIIKKREKKCHEDTICCSSLPQ